jgi:hypothetical protein
MGSDAGVFAGGQYDEDDREADQIWEQIDNFMDDRRRVSGAALGGGGRELPNVVVVVVVVVCVATWLGL